MADRISREEAANVVRSIFRRCGYAVAEHGTRGRDLDLVAVPWTDRAGMPSIIVAEVIDALDGELLGKPEEKPHGRVAYAVRPGGTRQHDLWYVDLSVVVPAEYRDEIEPRPFVTGRCDYCGCTYRKPSDALRHCCAAMQMAVREALPKSYGEQPNSPGDA